MKNWIVKKKLHSASNESDSQTCTVGGVNSVLVASPDSHSTSDCDVTITDSSHLAPILEDSETVLEHHYGSVELDLLESPDSLNVLTISGNVTPFSDFKVPMGSVHSDFSSQVLSDSCQIVAVPSLATSISLSTAVVLFICFLLNRHS